ncbi:MAG TPA: bifunctional glycosyltransferase family 2/GtrA family protein [Edaphobacter sp.]|nr:bifunctional glycosyltransferase family 2/GtrA family protein [Edaphobacter sp.]
MSRGFVVLIPAWNPAEDLCPFVAELFSVGFAAVVVVDDGSDSSSRGVFDSLSGTGVHVLRHAVNLGKGRALKTGFNFVLDRLADSLGVVTADADGQHRVEDVVRVAEALNVSPCRTILGCRQFVGAVPLRSSFGNTVTRWVFRLVTGRRVSDTQTGLRAFPMALLPELMGLPGERYEYEMTVLGHLCRAGSALVEVPIATVYIDGNRSSHFDPIRDSMRIYFVLLRFYASSLVAAGIDFAGFSVAFALTHDVLTSFVVGRLSSLANFLLNKRYVFHSETSIGGSLGRYYLLAIAMAAVSYGSIRGLTGYFGWNVFAAKLAVDTLLSFASFAVQRTFVFPAREED